jgi:hypothetical protein
MPKQVFIESRNQTLEFPDEATQEQINDAVTAMFPPTGKDMADYVEGVKNAAMEGQDLVDPFQQMSDDNYVLFKQYQADQKTSPGEFFGIAKDTFNQVRDELATGIGTAAYKTYQGEGAEVAKSLGEGMTAGMVGTYDILNKIFDPAQPIPRKEDFVGKVAKPDYTSNAFMGMGGMSPNVAGQGRVNTEEDYKNLIASEKQRDSEIVNRLYAMESTMRNASIPEVARGGQFVDPMLAAGLGSALVKVALKGGKTILGKAALQYGARAAGTEVAETAAETAARTAGTVADNIPTPIGPTPTTVIDTIESGGMRPFTPDPNAPNAAFASTAPPPMVQAGLRAAEGAAGTVQFTAGLPSQGLKKLGEFVETVAPGMGTAAQGTVLGGSVIAGAPAVFLAQAKTTEKVAEFLRSFLRVSQEEASRAGRLERVALDPLTSPVVRKAAAGLAQFQPIARTVIDLSKGALKGGAAGSVVGGALGGLAERNLEGAAAGMGAGLALGGFYGSLNAGFDIGKEAFGGSTLRTRTNASGDINRFIASRPELEQAGWTDAMRVLVEKIGPERAASQMDALRVAEASGVKLRIATPDENKLWKAPGWLDPDKGELVLNPPKVRAGTPAHEATHAIIASNVKRQYRAQIEEAIYGIPDPVTGEIVKPGFLDDAALAKIAEQISESYRKGDQKIAADRFKGLTNNLKNSTDKESLIKARSDIADEIAADYGDKFFDRVRAGRFNPDRLPLVYRNALNAIDDGIFNTFKSVVYERGMDLGFDNTTKSFRDANGKPIRVPQLDEIFKRAYSQKSSAETVVSKKPDLIPVKPADRAIWAKTYGGARGVLNEDNTPKSIAQINAEAASRWQNMVNKMAPLPENERGGIEFSRDKSGKTTMTAQGQLSPAALTAILESDMLDASANAVLRDVIMSLQDPNKSTFDTRYYKAYEQKGTKMVAGVYPASQSEILPYKVTMNSKDGVNIHAVDMTKVRQRLATAMNKPQFKDLYSNPTDALKDFKRYLENITQVGMPEKVSAQFLGGGETGAAKRNLFYEALGFRLRNNEALTNVPDSVIRKSETLKTYRVERFTKLVDTGFKFPFEEATTYERAMKNFQPAAFTPETLPNGEAFTNPDGFRILNKTGSKLFRTYDDTGKLIGVAESKEKAVKKAMDEATKRMEKQSKKPSIIEAPPVIREFSDGYKLTQQGVVRFQPTIAYHGTPHKVDKFSTAKIGTGEGAQAFGYGLYFAKVKEIAKGYAEKLAPMGPVKDPWWKDMVRQRMAAGDTLEQAKAQVSRNYPALKESMKDMQLEDFAKPVGNLYTVELLPDEAAFLDWDKPLSQQSEQVKQFFKDSGINAGYVDSKGSKLYEQVGRRVFQEIYGERLDADQNPFLALGDSGKGASEMLAKAGIPGVRYLDGSSRAAGEGTHNYVIFDDSLVKILEENGKPRNEKSLDNSTSSKRFQSVTPEQDAAYLQAVQAGDSETAQRLVDDAAKAISPEVARTMLRPSEKEGGVDPRSGKMWVLNGKQYLFEKMPLDSIGKNQNGDLYDSTTRRNLAENYAKREGDFPPIILTQSKIDGIWEVRDGGHRISAARMRGDQFIDTIRQFSQPDPVTYDNAGNVIPLSERFNPKSNDIRFQPDPASPNILNGTDGSRIIKSNSGKYRVYLATGALAGVKDTLESAQKLVQAKSNK